MELYQNILSHLAELVRLAPVRRKYPYDAKNIRRETERCEMIMKRHTAYELGDSGTASANCTIMTTETGGIFSGNQTIVVGKDLCEIHQDTSYARIVVLTVAPEMLEESENNTGEMIFRNLQKLDFVKYHVFMDGCMLRISPESCEEHLRIHKSAIADKISFEQLGNTFIRRFLAEKYVKSVTVIFFADYPEEKYQLSTNCKKVREITQTFSKILEGMPTDCNVCKMKAICDEIEGMRELHFGKGVAK